MTKGQEVYERIEALTAGGMQKADAFRKLAEEYGQPVKSVQGSYYTYSRKLTGGGSPSRSRKRETTTADAIEDATAVLERALAAIDTEIEAAAERAAEAKREHEAMKASATERKQAITAKIEALSA